MTNACKSTWECARRAGLLLFAFITGHSLLVGAFVNQPSGCRPAARLEWRRYSYSPSYQSFQPLGTPRKKVEPMPGFTLGLQNETAGTANEEYIVNITQPLGIFIEESPDKSGMVYVAEVGEKAEEAGIEVGDVIIGCSFVFGDAYLVNVTGAGVDKVQSLIRSRGADYVCLRLRKGCDYHLLEPIPDMSDEDERGMKREEKEAFWINRARKIYIDEFPIDLSAIEDSADDDDDP